MLVMVFSPIGLSLNQMLKFLVLFATEVGKKTNLEILLSAHARTSQADILHLDQKAVKCTTCKRVCGKF